MTLEEFAKANETEVQVTKNWGDPPSTRFKCTLAGTAVYQGGYPTYTYGYDSSRSGARREYVRLIRGKRMVLHFQTHGQQTIAVPLDLTV